MRPGNWIEAKADENGVITLSVKDSVSSLEMIACSVETSADGANEIDRRPARLTNFSFFVEKEVEVLVAVVVKFKNSSSQMKFLLHAERSLDGKACIDLDRVWTPQFPNRMGQIYHHGVKREMRFWSENALNTCIDKIIYTSARIADIDIPENRNFRYVPDNQAICRYLLGKLSADELKTLVKEKEAEQLASIQLAEALEENAKVSGQLKYTVELLEKTNKDNEKLYKKIGKYQEYIDLMHTACKIMVDKMKSLEYIITSSSNIVSFVVEGLKSVKVWQFGRKNVLNELLDLLPKSKIQTAIDESHSAMNEVFKNITVEERDEMMKNLEALFKKK